MADRFYRLRRISLKNKIFFSFLAVILFLSFTIALFTRWILVTGLTRELHHQGIAIAESIATRSHPFLKSVNNPELNRIIAGARQGIHKDQIAYILIMDRAQAVVAYTFQDRMPPVPRIAGWETDDAAFRVEPVALDNETVFNISMPVQEKGIKVGSVHVGVKTHPIDQLIAQLRNMFVGFLSAATIFCFGLSHLLAGYITRPISRLIRLTDQIRQGRLDTGFDHTRIQSLNREVCDDTGCPGFEADDRCCYPNTPGRARATDRIDETACNLHLKHVGDEVTQLARAFQNMTVQLRQSQKELQNSEASYRSLFNSGPNPIFVINRVNLEILDVNPAAIRMFGYNRFELAAARLSELGKFEYEDQDLSETVAKGWPRGYIFRQNARLYRPGSHVPLYLRMKAVPIRYQDRDALVLALTNITATVEKDVQLIQASKMSALGEMSAGIAHELNQPLNAIKLGNDFLLTMLDQQVPIPDEDLEQVATEVNNQVARAAKIINRLRDFGRQTDFAKEHVDLNDAVKGVLKLIGPQLDIDNIDIALNLDENLPQALAHRNRMDQILFNLIANARDAINLLEKSDAGVSRQIGISTHKKLNRVVLSVSDSGIGIPEELRNRIFEPFFTTKVVGKGMGLGLAIIYSIVKEYGGKISTRARPEGGTTFTLAFPAEKKKPLKADPAKKG